MNALQLAVLGRRARRDGLHHLAEPLAIVGMGCRTPGGVQSPGDLWDLLRAGTVTTREVPSDRWDTEEWYDPDPSTPGRTSVKSGSFLDRIDRFDPAFFGIPPREAERIDPHQRLALEVAWEALEDAGIRLDQIRGEAVGVFTASYNDDFVLHHYLRPDTINERTITGVVQAVVANRISHFLGVHGPSITVDTACSSSLVALHLATRSLRDGSCDLALAGGVSLMLRPEPFISLSKAGFMSPDGRCKTFDERADGFGRGEGCGFIVLKRLADALEQGDRVISVVRGSAVNQDGPSTILAAPNGRAQAEVVRAALRDAGLEASAVGYIEAHGTGTRLGDPIEVEALGEALGPPPPGAARWLASAKSNLGHLEAAAGIVGVIRAALSIQHGFLPPHAGFESPNPLLELERHGFQIPVDGRTWSSVGPRTAGVSSFGVGGTNAHVILEEAPRVPAAAAAPTDAPWPLAISAQGDEALAVLALRHAEMLEAGDEDAEAFRRHCAATVAKRSRLPDRLAVVAASRASAAMLLRRAAEDPTGGIAGVRRGRVQPGTEARPVFVFSGQGSQWDGMADELVRDEPVVRATLEEIDQIFEPLADWSLREALAGGDSPWTLDDTAFAQPAIFAIQVAVTRLLESWGIRPFAVVGHSVGEVAAGHVSGHLDLETAVRMVHQRGRLMQEADSQGAMLATRLTRAEAEEVVAGAGGSIQLAAVNAPRSTVFSGGAEAVATLEEQLVARGTRVKRLPVRYGFHSAMMTPIAGRIRSVLQETRRQSEHTAAVVCDLVSTITGGALGRESFSAGHLARGVDGPVLFGPAIARTLERGATAFLEVGPRPVLTGDLLEITQASGQDIPLLSTLRREGAGRAAMVEAAAALFCTGVEPDWAQLTGNPPSDHPLPSYPWQRSRHWLDSPERGSGTPGLNRDDQALLGHRLDSPAISDAVFETRIHEADARVSDHRIRDAVLVPAAMMLEMARQAGERVLGEPVDVVDAAFLHKVVLDVDPHRLHLVVKSGEPEHRRRRVALYAGAPGGRWILAFEAQVRPSPGPLSGRRNGAPGASGSPDPERYRDLDVEQLYRVAAEAGAQFGAGYRRLIRLQIGAGEALGELSTAGLRGDEGLSPALLDAALHPTLALLGMDAPVHLPASIGAFATKGGTLPTHSFVREVEAPADARAFHIRLLDDDGSVVGRIDRLVLRPAPSDLSVLRRPDEALHTIGWREVESPQPEGPETSAVQIVADQGGFSDRLAAHLRENGTSVELLDGSTDPNQAEGRGTGLVVCAALDVAPDGIPTVEELSGAAADLARPVLRLAAASGARPAPVLLLSRGAHGPDGNPEGGALASAGLAGLARTLRRERPELAATALDLPATPEDDEARLIHALLRSSTDEPVLALRSGRLLAPRLETAGTGTRWDRGARTRIVEFTEPGNLGSVRLTEVDRRAPVNDEVEVRVRRAALNFRDVLAGLEMVEARTDRALGHECAGIVTRVGPEVSRVRPGDRVLALAEGGFGDHALCPERRIFSHPAGAGWSDAVSLPIAALTAHHALLTLGGLQAGQRVLVHSGAGGVGQAAVRLAMARGAEVYATAGTAAKRAHLESMGIRGAFDSRSLLFRDGILEATAGKGVDLVLNSLTGEAIDAGLSLLPEGGVFIELGKRDLREPHAVAEAWPGVQYHSFDLFDEIDRAPVAQHDAWEEIRTAVESGDLSPLPMHVFPRARIEEALRFMARAEHVGKIVLHVSDRRDPVEIRRDGGYLVTGGTGGVGLTCARWLVERGAGRVLLSSRTPPSGEAAETMEDLQAAGADIRWIGADLEKPEAVRSLVEQAGEGGITLRGVVHAAAALDDGLLADLDVNRFLVPFDAKVKGAVHLARYLNRDSLDFLLLCSAAGSHLDPGGQGNYAAANQTVEALGRRLTEAGWPVTSVAWGLWDRGMAGGDGGAVARRWRRMGLGAIDGETGPALFDAILAAGEPLLVPALLDHRRLLQEAAHLGPLLDGLRQREDTVREHRTGSVAQELRSLPAHRRGSGLRRHLAARLARVLGVPADDIEVERPFRDQGMDSLMAVEIRNILTRDLGVSLSATLAFDYPDIPAMASHLSHLVFGQRTESDELEGPSDGTGEATAEARLDMDPEIASLSDEEAERLLLAELEALVADDEGQGT